MKAIILTAGSGRRMRPLTDTTHKTLIEIKGKTVIQWIVDALLENGITDLLIVTGHQAEALKAHLAQVYPALKIIYVHNERYAETNNIYSLSLALDKIILDSDVVLIECDLIFEPSVIRRLLSSPHANIALVDRYRRGMDGTVVAVADGVVTEVIPPHRQGDGFCFGDKYKTLNIYRFSKEFCDGPFRKLLNYYAAVINDNVFYELVLGIIIYLGHTTIHAEILCGEKWAELDDPNDVNIARFQFDPAARKDILSKSLGGLWNCDLLDFCYIRNMYFPSGSILSELRNNLPELLQNYGSAQTVLNRKMAYYLMCRPEPVMAINGASQAYPWLQKYFSGCNPLIPSPTFLEYSRIFPQAVHYSDSVGSEPDEIAERARSHDLVVLVNPNNPTGSVLSSTWIQAFAAQHPDKTVIVDESFIDFSSEPSLLPLLEAAPLSNVILLKSLSKALGVPGLRLGFVYTTHPGFQNFMRQSVPVWNLNSLAEHFLEIILKHRGTIQDSFAQTMAERESFAVALRELPIVKNVFPSGGNFLLTEIHLRRCDSAALVARLLNSNGIHVKDVSSRFPGDATYWRLAVRLPKENMHLASILSGAEGSVS